MALFQPKTKKARKKSPAQRLWFLHWLMAFFYLLLFIGGKYMAGLPESLSYRETIFDTHKTLGVVVMSILLARISLLLSVMLHKYRRRRPKHKRGRLKTVTLHIILYFFMLLVPLSGYFDSNVGSHDIRIFATNIVLPPLFPPNEQWEVSGFADSVHFWISYTFLAFIILHALDQKRYLRAQLRRFSKATLAKIKS
ncbi:MAG: cytochrome b/b6 domain-containing protein [Pleurocapsa sp. MO_192.B19]|nr:cytochrome b/b6 domain-containing protein [Pleurocapsa sp. MO_192.B19]